MRLENIDRRILRLCNCKTFDRVAWMTGELSNNSNSGNSSSSIRRSCDVLRDVTSLCKPEGCDKSFKTILISLLCLESQLSEYASDVSLIKWWLGFDLPYISTYSEILK